MHGTRWAGPADFVKGLTSQQVQLNMALNTGVLRHQDSNKGEGGLCDQILRLIPSCLVCPRGELQERREDQTGKVI